MGLLYCDASNFSALVYNEIFKASWKREIPCSWLVGVLARASELSSTRPLEIIQYTGHSSQFEEKCVRRPESKFQTLLGKMTLCSSSFADSGPSQTTGWTTHEYCKM